MAHKNSPDFVTLLRTNHRANKLVTRDEEGRVEKSKGVPISLAKAQTVYVPDATAMKSLLEEIADDPNSLIIPSGYFPGTEPTKNDPIARGDDFTVVSKKVLKERLGFQDGDPDASLGWHRDHGERLITRQKANMSATSWMLFDRDEVKGMPTELADMTDGDWHSAMAEIIPGFSDTPKVKLSSSTGRVLVEGVPMAATGQHYYLQNEDGEDLERFGATLLMRSFLTDYGFKRPIYSSEDRCQVVGHRQWSIFDPSTFSRERLAYEGAPTINGHGLELAPAKIEVL